MLEFSAMAIEVYALHTKQSSIRANTSLAEWAYDDSSIVMLLGLGWSRRFIVWSAFCSELVEEGTGGGRHSAGISKYRVLCVRQ